MINLDDRIIGQVNESELWVLLNIAKRMRSDRMSAWPSIDTLANDCRWTVNTARKWRDSLVKKGFITIEHRPGGSSIVTLSKSGISVFTPLDGTYQEEEKPRKKDTPPLPNFGTPPLPNFGTPPLPNFGTPPLPNFGRGSILTREVQLTSEVDAPAIFNIEIHEPAKNESVVVRDIFAWFGRRPNANTGVELSNAMKALYVMFPDQFKVDIMEGGKAQKYTKEERADIIMEWACHIIKTGKGNDTYQRLNADLQQWFLRQPGFKRTNHSQTNPAEQAKSVDIKI